VSSSMVLKVPKCSRFIVYHKNASHSHEQFIERCRNAINYLQLKHTMKNKMSIMKFVNSFKVLINLEPGVL
jgi:hypothetical protein